jgi:glycosyltransferase 2 family protein
MSSEIDIPPETSPEAPPEKSAGRRRLVALGQTVLVVAALGLTWRLIAGIHWGDLAARLGTASWPLVVLATLLLAARYAIWDMRFRLAAGRTIGRAPHAVLGFFVLLASAALNLLTPSARLIGGLMRARYFARSTRRPFGLLYGVVLYDQIAHHTVMTLCTWLTLIATAHSLGYHGIAAATLAALLVAGAVLYAWSRRRAFGEDNPIVRLLARRAARQEGRLGRLYAHGQEAVGTFARLLAVPRLQLQSLALGCLFFVVNSLAQWLIFRSIGEPIGLLPVIAVVALGGAAGIMTGTPGGVGTTEAAMVAGFVTLGMDRVDASAGTLLYRGLHYAVVLAVGLPALAVLELYAARAEARAAEAVDTY